jgi:hypothetical protein
MRIKEDPNEDIIPDTVPLPENLTAGSNDGYGNKVGRGGYHKKEQQPMQPSTSPTPPPNPIMSQSPSDFAIVDLAQKTNDLFNM